MKFKSKDKTFKFLDIGLGILLSLYITLKPTT